MLKFHNILVDLDNFLSQALTSLEALLLELGQTTVVLPDLVYCSILKPRLSDDELFALSLKTNVDTHTHIQSSIWDRIMAVKKTRNKVASKKALDMEATKALTATELFYYYSRFEWTLGIQTG